MYPASYLASLNHSQIKALANLKTGLVKTPHSTFDRAANHPEKGYVGTGNVSSAVQGSHYIRAFCTTECNGFTKTPGQLQAFDLAQFKRLPWGIRTTVEREARDRDLILYGFGHSARGRWITHGYVLTGTYYRLVRAWVCGPTRKSAGVIEAVTPHIAWIDSSLDNIAA